MNATNETRVALLDHETRHEEAQFRIAIAMALTMLAEAAESGPGPDIVPATVLAELSEGLLSGDEKSMAFLGSLVDRMTRVRIVDAV